MDLALIGLILGCFSGAALVGVWSYRTGRASENQKFNPPSKTTVVLTGVLMAFMVPYALSRDILESWQAFAIFIFASFASGMVGYCGALILMLFIGSKDED